MSTVSVIKTPSYELEVVREAVHRHFALLEVEKELSKGMRVLLKPNLLMKRRPEEFTTTHPALVEAVVLELEELGIEDIVLADSPGGPYSLPLLQGIYQASGMTDVCKRTCLRLNTDLSFSHRSFLKGETCKEFNLITPILEADYIINLSKIKTHGMTTMSGGVKNLFGTVPGLQKPELHFRFSNTGDFCNMLVDLSLLVAPQLTLADGVVAMEGDGPSGGVARELGLTLASRELYSLDRVQCGIMGLTPEQVPTVAHSIRRGLCPDRLEDIDLLGDPIPDCAPFKIPKSRNVDFLSHAPRFLRGPLSLLRDSLLTPRPVIRVRDCIGCGRCAQSCPAKTIQIQKGKAVIDYGACIRCYCCHELCPVKAIDIRRFRFFDL